jgi:predicted metal-dependent phosphoesterase TrpH
MKIDLHCHSEASHDCKTPLQHIIERCHFTGIHVQAITDHNQIWGAQNLQELTKGDKELTIIVGEEISTSEGEIIGLFLTERIPPRLSAQETIQQIRSQGGVVLVPHGFDPFKHFRLHPETLAQIAKDVHIIEVFNAHISSPVYNRAALRWAEQHKKLKSAGTDAHTAAHVGSAWVETPRTDIRGPEDLLTALSMGEVGGRWRHPARTFASRMKDLALRTYQRERKKNTDKSLRSAKKSDTEPR